jgi:pilus assembly protein Flp/PilA
MGTLRRWLGNLVASEEGPTAVEYAVMLALIIATCMLAITSLGTSTNNSLTRSGNATRFTGS